MKPEPEPKKKPGLCSKCGHSWDDHESTRVRLVKSNSMYYFEGFVHYGSQGLCQARVWTENNLPRRCGCTEYRPWEGISAWVS